MVAVYISLGQSGLVWTQTHRVPSSDRDQALLRPPGADARDGRTRLEADPEQAGGRALAGGPEHEPPVRRPDGNREVPVDVLQEHARFAAVRPAPGTACRAACCSTGWRSRRTRWCGHRETTAETCRCRRSRGGAAARRSPRRPPTRRSASGVVGGRIGAGLEGDPAGSLATSPGLAGPRSRLRSGAASSEVSRSCSQRWVIRNRRIDHLRVALFSPALLFLFGKRIACREEQSRAVGSEPKRSHRLVVPGHLPRLAAVGIQEVHLRPRVRFLAARGQERDDPVPSGDHAGAVAFCGPRVSCRLPVPSTRTRQR